MTKFAKFKLLSVIFMFALTFIGAATAVAEMTIVTVDVNRILNESKSSKKEKAVLDKLSLDAKKKVAQKQESLKSLEAKLKKSPDEKKEEELRDKARELQRFVKDTEADLRREFMKVNKKLTDKVLSEIESYAKSNKIDLVLEKSEVARGPVLFGEASADITDEIIKQINS